MFSPAKCLVTAALLLATFTTFAQPANDDCSGAILLNVSPDTTCANSVSGSTEGAGLSGVSLCHPGYEDVWYRFVASATAHTVALSQVSLQDSSNARFFVEIFSGNCNTLRRLFCSNVYYWEREFHFGDLQPDSTYYIRVVNYDYQPIRFNICVRTPPPPPVNDACAGAVVLDVDSDAVCNAPTLDSTQNATASLLPVCSACDFASDDVWFTFTATQANHIVTLSNVEAAGQPGVEQRLVVTVFSGTCDSLTSAARSLHSGDKIIIKNSAPGDTYYLRLSSWRDDPTIPVSFHICVTSPPPPVNDACAGAILLQPQPALDCTDEFTGALHDATQSGPDCQGGVANDVWYQFVATSPSHRIVMWGDDHEPYGFELYEGDCDHLVSLVCDNEGEIASLTTGFTVGVRYYLRVFSPSLYYFNFHICIMTLPLPPANDECSGALPLPVNAGFSCDLQTTGSTLGATTSEPDCAGEGHPHDVWYSFVAAGPAQRLEINPTAVVAGFGGDFRLGFEVFSGDCSHLHRLLCVPNASPYYVPILSGLNPGETYFIRVYSVEQYYSEFSICIQTLPPPPSNGSCAQAALLIPSPDPACTTPTASATAGMVPDSGATSFCSDDTDISVWYKFTATNTTHILQVDAVQSIYGQTESDFRVALYEGTDCENLTAKNCSFTSGRHYLNNLQIGQTYFLQGISRDFSAHSFKICLGSVPAPANDDCASAITLSVNAAPGCGNLTAGTTAGSSSVSEAACFGNAGDVWYQFTATQAAHHIGFQNIASVEPDFHAQLSMELLTGSCGNMTSVQCWNNTFDPEANLLIGELTTGQTYYLRISSPYEVPVNFSICVSTPPPPPVNDACAAAITLTPEVGTSCTPVAGTTVGATVFPSLPSFQPVSGDVWYSFVATQVNHDIHLSDIINGSQSGYARITLYATACGNPSTFIDQFIYAEGNAEFTNLTPGETYYVQVAGDEPILFNLCLLAPPAPVNDECTGALPLPINYDLSCDTLLTASMHGATPSRPACDGTTGNDTWYQFTATTQTYRFDISYDYNYFGTWGYEILSGDCNDLTSLHCEYPGRGAPFLRDSFIPGNVYYLRLYNLPNIWTNITICTRALPLSPANDECTGALPLIPAADLSCDVPVTGSTLGATSLQPDCNSGLIRDVWYSFVATGLTQLLEAAATKSYFDGFPSWGFEVLGGDCNELTSLFCSGYQPPNPKVLYDLTPGQTYYIRVFSENFQAHDFSICLKSLPPPANHSCAQATPVLPNAGVACDTTYSGTTLGAASVWYTFTATSNSHIFELENATLVFGNTPGVSGGIYRGDCTDPEHIGDIVPGYPTLLQDIQPGETIYVQVYSDANSASTFDLCIKTLPPSPGNETCAGAMELNQNNSLECDVVNAGSTAGAINGNGQNCTYGHDVWYKFIATGQVYQIQVINDVAILGSEELRFGVLQSPDCINFSTLACGNAGQTIYLNDLTPGETYYVQVSSGLSSAHHFDLCVKAVPPPQNDLCATASPLDVNPEQHCNGVTDGTTYGAGPSGGAGCGYDANDVWYSFTATGRAHTIYVDSAREAVTSNYAYYSLTLYAGDCGHLQILGCRQELTNSTELTVGDLTVGSVYYIRISGKDNDIDFGICVTSPPPPPANDACVNATVLPVYPDENCVVPVAGTTEYATATPQVPNQSYENDVWYAFTASQSNHLITVSNIVNNAVRLEVYTGVCGAFTTMNIYSFQQTGQIALTNLTPGTLYYFRVSSFGDEPTSFEVCVVSPPIPPNDECVGATPLVVDPYSQLHSCQHPTTASTFGATSSLPDCTGSAVNDIWFRFTATGVSQRLEIAAVRAFIYPFNYSGTYGLEVFGGDCGALTAILPCTVVTNSNDIVRYYTVQSLVAGNTYYLRLYAVVNEVKSFTICLSALPEPPANDDCAHATVIQANTGIDCEFTYTGSTLGATPSAPSCEGHPTHDVWYQFTATAVAQVINMWALDRLGMELYSGTGCTDLQPLACKEYGTAFILQELNLGATYYIRVFSRQHESYDFSLCIRTLPPLPPNADCINAETVIPSPDLHCTQPVSGLTGGSGVTEGPFTGCWTGTSLWYQFTATSSTHLLELRTIFIYYGGPYLNLELYQGSCTDLQRLDCNHGHPYLLRSDLSPGTTYYIRVVGAANSAASFDLCVLTVPPPINTSCADAIVLPAWPANCENTVTGSLFGPSPQQIVSECNFQSEVWYKFEATNANHIIEINNIRGDFYPTIELFSGVCGQLTSLGCFSTDYHDTYTDFEPGTTYYLRVGSTSTSTLPIMFDICISTPQPDLAVLWVEPPEACAPGNAETIKVQCYNVGPGVIPVGAAALTLQVTGANTGTYGPVQNTELLYPYEEEWISFTGVDLSNPGMSTFTITSTLPYDANPGNNSQFRGFIGFPLLNYFMDSDDDGYGDPAHPVSDCYHPAGTSANNTDCDDTNADVHPDAPEVCDGLDNDCNGLTDGEDPGLTGAPAPGITCPDNIIVPNDPGVCSAIVNYTVSTTDYCGFTVTQPVGLASGEAFPVGTTGNTFTVSDPTGNEASCSFTVQVQKTADASFLYAYTILGVDDVLLKNNRIQSGGLGLVNANKKARLQAGTTVTGPLSFVKAPILELQGGSQVTTYYNGGTGTGLLPVFQPNGTNANNNLNIPDNSAPVVLSSGSYGNVIIGLHATVTFSGYSTVRIKELTIHNGAKILFAQPTELLIKKGMVIAKNVGFNAGEPVTVQCFAAENVTVDQGSEVSASIYTLKDLLLSKASATVPTRMTGLFIAKNVSAQDFVYWNRSESCPANNIVEQADLSEDRSTAPSDAFGHLQISPNPASEEVQVSFHLETATVVTLQLLDAAGRLVWTEQFEGSVGANSYPLHLGKVKEGIYTVQMLAQGQREVEKLVVLRP